MIPNHKRSNQKRKGPLHDLRMNLPNPFTSYSQPKNNFPGIDAIFKRNSPPDHRNNNDYDDGNSYYDRGGSSNLSISSPDRSSIFASTDLNMSIGARAAIYEHTRHVTKYGLDGDFQVDNSSPTKSTIHSSSDEWERLMDGVPCNTSIIADSNVSASFSFYRNGNGYGNTIYAGISENNTLDTTDENQSDYFNSSRVMQSLATPEKNKKKVDEASRLARLGIGVAVRGECAEDDAASSRNWNESVYYSESGSASGGNSLEQSGMLGMFHAAMRLGEQSIMEGGMEEEDVDDDAAAESFISFHEPDMSIIHMNQKPLLEDNDMDYMHAGLGGDNFTDVETDIYDNESSIHIGGDIQASFISYRDPDVSIISRHGGEGMNMNMNMNPRMHSKANSEFCRSEFGPDLSMISGHGAEGININMHLHSKAHSEFGRSDFDVDVSEIIAPSDIGSKLPSVQYSSPFRKSTMRRLPTSPEESVGMVNYTEDLLFSPCGTPIRSRGQSDNSVLTPPSSSQMTLPFRDQYAQGEGIGWPSASPLEEYGDEDGDEDQMFSSSSPSDETSPKLSRSLRQQFESTVDGDSVSYIAEMSMLASEINSGDDLATASPLSHERFETPPSPQRQKGRDPLTLKANISFLSPIDMQCSSEETKRSNRALGKDQVPLRDVNNQLKNSMKVSPFTALNPRATGQIREMLGGIGTRGQAQPVQNKTIGSQRISLKDRYSRPDRFEDSYSVPSSARTPHSSAKTYNDDEAVSVNRSLLEVFENDYDTPLQQKEFAARRFAV